MAGQVGNEDGDVGFQIAPMVDVVFVLMLFFMASAGMKAVERELGINLPSGGAGPSSAAITPIILDITDDGQVILNDQAYDTPNSKEMPQLRAWLANTVEQFGTDDPVIIRPSMRTRHERVIDVLSAASASGVKNLTFS